MDLVLCGELPLLGAEDVALELDDLLIPVHFYVQAMNAIQHRGLREHIARVGQVLYSRSVDAAKPVSIPRSKIYSSVATGVTRFITNWESI